MAITPASIRNNNPGAQEPGPSSRKFGSTSFELLKWTYKGKPATNKIATFPTNHHGAAAMFHLLMHGRSKVGVLQYRNKPIQDAIATWCGGYYAGAYAKALEAHGGVKASDKLTAELLQSPEFAIPLCKAMARVEAGRDFPLDDDGWQEAHGMAVGGSVAPEFSPDNDVPSPGPNARLKAAINDKKEAITLGITAVAAGGKAMVDSQPEAPAKPKLDPKAAIAKAKELRETTEQAKDIGVYVRDFVKWGAGDGAYVVGGIGVALVIGLAWNWWRR